MKIAFSGKGGVGKTTLVALLAREAARRGRRVLVVDADSDPNVATALGIDDPVIALADDDELVARRAGEGGFIRLNPSVADLPDRYTVEKDRIRLLVLGGIRGGGAGCACPAHALLKALLAHLLVEEDDVVLLDMEAGIEHLGRGSVAGVDGLVLVVEADRKALDTAERTLSLARDLAVTRIVAVANRVQDDDDAWIRAALPASIPLAGTIPELVAIRRAMRRGALPPGLEVPSITRLFDRLRQLHGEPNGSGSPSHRRRLAASS